MKDVSALDASVGSVVAGSLGDARADVDAAIFAQSAAIADLQAQLQILHDTFEGRVVAAVRAAKRHGRL